MFWLFNCIFQTLQSDRTHTGGWLKHLITTTTVCYWHVNKNKSCATGCLTPFWTSRPLKDGHQWDECNCVSVTGVLFCLLKVLCVAGAAVGADRKDEWWPQSPKQDDMCKTQWNVPHVQYFYIFVSFGFYLSFQCFWLLLLSFVCIPSFRIINLNNVGLCFHVSWSQIEAIHGNVRKHLLYLTSWYKGWAMWQCNV